MISPLIQFEKGSLALPLSVDPYVKVQSIELQSSKTIFRFLSRRCMHFLLNTVLHIYPRLPSKQNKPECKTKEL